ncbi:hypothetical protein HH_0157 [Helicobacter hepaticus ATCC 51449]|uniref:Uncharacterized protein n=1 Tax=Helicobacter hepaticus (strain ATCC 51449 / 3B1) TaxID=235279 RepID=Q7VJT6_HELHP|nr:hypothetical protein HH_0157 [Helicobacter hepaticus ATCC 51449]
MNLKVRTDEGVLTLSKYNLSSFKIIIVTQID